MLRTFRIAPQSVMAFLLTLLAVNTSAPAHDSLDRQLLLLSRQIRIGGASADLLVRRAYKYRAIGNADAAESDLRAAIDLDPEASEPHRELARVLTLRGSVREALIHANDSVGMATTDPERLAARQIRAEIHERSGNLREAIVDCEAALAIRPDDLETLLRRSRLQKRLRLTERRTACLDTAIRSNGSIVLEREYIDSLIDGARYRDAIDRLTPHLNRAKYTASWRILLARALDGLGRRAEAARELEYALTELTDRINEARPDPLLVRDRDTALALLR